MVEISETVTLSLSKRNKREQPRRGKKVKGM
jgi:hypothetical protein